MTLMLGYLTVGVCGVLIWYAVCLATAPRWHGALQRAVDDRALARMLLIALALLPGLVVEGIVLLIERRKS